MWKDSGKKSILLSGSIIHNNGKIEEDITIKVKTGWLKRGSASEVLCDLMNITKLKGKFLSGYKACYALRVQVWGS